ncbi:MAG: gluconolactonase [Rheinheimera sp.]|uniref:SMP-30/gluconolactonase/LRE family protein n=1 Tax=Arsukibacterium sp. UBA3155 TaxID=1946058 RepID=UPI000C9662B6|nr:SMP-30/gluconolactonase/LRE family protein [Arsukibacterium sp. UBA3155]MAD75466.1 gluconolactonase [Rheinheimera sp.]|tara:strand:+ start:21394 stop:22404 length:1011 start_codon:yes stop_codon:yes gene_type:complete
MRVLRVLSLLCGVLCAVSSANVFGQLPAQPVLVQQPEMLQLVAADAQLEILAEGFRWSEGPVVEPDTGDVLFSDVPANKVYRWNLKDGLTVYLAPSGYTGLYPDYNRQQGANGLIFNHKQQLVLAQHGDRRLAILTEIQDGQPQYQTLVNYYQGKLLNSPNDLVQHSSGAYYFTDPPYGLRGGDKADQKQLTANAVYRLAADGTLTAQITHLNRPNGLAFSPDEKWLYVANSDASAAQWWRSAVASDGSLGPAQLFFDATGHTKTSRGLPDGLKVLPSGHLLATGPGGVWVFTAEGTHLGTIHTGVAAANVALTPDNRYLYITATNYLLRIALIAP